MNLTVFSPSKGDVLLDKALLDQIMGGDGTGLVSTAITTVGAGVLTAAGLLGGVIARTGPTAAFTDTTATAAAIVAALGSNISVGQTFMFAIKNMTAYPETLAGGTGVTITSDSLIVPPFSVGNFFGTIGGTQASPTVTILHISTVPLRDEPAPQFLALTTVGAGTITAAGFAAGATARSGSTAAFTDTTDTAVAIIAAISSLAIIGQSVTWTYVNNTVAEATLAGGVGVTITGALSVPPNSWATFVITRTAAATVSMAPVGQGYFPTRGTFTCNGVTPVVVSATAVTATSQISVTLKTVGGTVGAIPAVQTITPATGFTIAGTAADTSVYNYEVRG